MKVYQLIWHLLRCNPSDIVVLAGTGTEEGTPLDGVGKEMYDAETTWYGNLGMRSISAEDREKGYTDEDLGSGENCVVLWPIN